MLEKPDPTENVIALNEATIKRLDDLRDQATHFQEIIADLVSRHLAEMSALRGEFGEKLRNAEADRINAIRAVDIGAVQRAAEVSASQAQTLANQVAQSAETLRTQVAAAATASATALAAALDPIQKDIADLRKTQYEQAGQKAQVVEGRSTNSVAIAAMMAFMGLITLAVLLYATLKK